MKKARLLKNWPLNNIILATVIILLLTGLVLCTVHLLHGLLDRVSHPFHGPPMAY